MRSPLSFATGNVIFGGGGPNDAWALYRVTMTAYAGLSVSAKRDVLGALAGFAFSVEEGFQLLRVSRPWSASAYHEAATAGADPSHTDVERLEAYLDGHESYLAGRRVSRPELFVAVALPRADRSADGWRHRVGALRGTLGLSDSRAITRRRLEELRAGERRIFSCIGDFLDCERASTDELQWLVRRGFTRGIAEPQIDGFWKPQALVIDAPPEDGGEAFQPLEADILRLCEDVIHVEPRALRVESEHGDSHQAFLTVGALPEVVSFPGRQAELLFAPLESVDFEVDAVVSVDWITNDRAVALARRKIVDADHTFNEEAHGDHGPTSSGELRPKMARELEEYLTAPERPPLLRGSIGLCVSAASPEELEEHVGRLRREYAPIALHRPGGAQLDLFVSHLPAQRNRVRDYDDVLTCEQLGAMVPAATHAVGAQTGMYIGHVLSGAEQPVLFDPTEASRTSQPPAVLCCGTLGSGKTLLSELLAYQAFLAGSRVVAVDPKGDHRLQDLLGPEEVERIELHASDRGRLDPLRIAPAENRGDLAYSFLVDILPSPVPPQWQTEIRDAVNQACAAGSRSCGDIIAILAKGDEPARDAARAIDVHAAGGLLSLGFAKSGTLVEEPGSRAVTLLRIANLILPQPGTAKTDMTFDERAGQALLRLLSTYALHLIGDDWSRHKVLIFDEGWMLLQDAVGRALVERTNRLCRSQNATPILATQTISNIEELEGLFGAAFCFRVKTDREAERSLTLLQMDADDPRLRSQLQGFRDGRCFMRDYDGRCAPVQIDLTSPDLLRLLDTSPERAHA